MVLAISALVVLVLPEHDQQVDRDGHEQADQADGRDDGEGHDGRRARSRLALHESWGLLVQAQRDADGGGDQEVDPQDLDGGEGLRRRRC